jgi:hypothetical protein
MTMNARNVVRWTPRILGLCFAGFLAIFAADVFEGHYSLGQLIVALAMHLIPTALVVLMVIVAWKREWVGAIISGLLGCVYIVTMWGRFPIDVYFLIAGPLFCVGILYLFGWKFRLREAAGS